MKTLPAHLQAIVNKVNKQNEEFKNLGGNPDWYTDALAKAEKEGDDNNLIHAVIPA